MLIKRSTNIGENETYSQLYARLSEMGGEVLMETLDAIEKDTLRPVPQNDGESCYSPMIRKEMSALDLTRTAAEVHNVIRGVTGFTTLGGKRLKIFASEISDNIAHGEPGIVIDPEHFTVSCGSGAVTFTEVQLEGSKRMKTQDFLRGKKLTKGEKLG